MRLLLQKRLGGVRKRHLLGLGKLGLARCRAYSAQERLATVFYKHIVPMELRRRDGGTIVSCTDGAC